jgi:outer membrane lipoprotein-sorting protein
MHKARKLVFAALAALLLLLPGRLALAADDLDKVLHKLDEAAKNFHSTSADFEFDSIETDPVYEKDVQKGTVYYERNGKNFRMAAHIREFDKKPAEKVYTMSGGVFRLFEGGNIDQVTTYSQASKFESYLMLGFGASGKDLAEKWEIKYLGPDTLLDEKKKVETEKLELVAKDPTVRKNISKVTLWVDPRTGVSLKQVFNEGPEEYRVSVYFNIKVNQPLPDGVFNFKTDGKTQYVNR